MIWVLTAFGAPGFPNLTSDEVRDAAELVADSERTVGELDGFTVSLVLRDQQPELSIRNDGEDALVVRWSDSEIAPPNAERTTLLRGGSREPEPGGSSSIDPGRTLTVVPIPKAWVDDGIDNDDAQWASWTETSFVTLELALSRGTTQATHTSEWRTDFDQEALKRLDLERAAQIAVAATPEPEPEPDGALLDRQELWDQSHRRLRVQGRIARPIWITAGSIGAGMGLLTGSLALSIPSAPETAEVQGDITKDEYRAAAKFYGALTGASLAIAIPTFIWDRSTRKKTKALGPRP